MEASQEIRGLQESALNWLIKVYDPTACGWGWLAHIPPNEQNTAEAVVAIIKHAQHLDQYKPLLADSIKHQLLNPEASVTKDWVWVAYALITAKAAKVYPDEPALDKAISSSLREVEALYDERSGGWPECRDEPCQVTWTSLSLILLGDHLTPAKVARAVRFLQESQNSDGGWGLWNIPEEELEKQFQSHPRLIAQASSQIISNAACTAMATWALFKAGGLQRRISAGVKWLLSNTLETGGWPVYQQIGVRKGETYTYRHFSTGWAIQALLTVDNKYVYNESVAAGIMYLLRLQDVATHGWRSSEDSDPFTWVTCNALDALDLVSAALLVRSPDMFKILTQWYQTRHLREVVTVDAFKLRFMFNNTSSFAGSILITVLTVCSIALLREASKPFQLTTSALLCIVAGIPWVFHFKGASKREWSEAIIFVYTMVGLVIAVLLSIGSVSRI